MRPEVHLRPDRLRRHAAAADQLADALLSALLGPGRPVLAGPADDELARLETGARRAIGELAEMASVLRSAASAAESADTATAGALGRILP